MQLFEFCITETERCAPSLGDNVQRHANELTVDAPGKPRKGRTIARPAPRIVVRLSQFGVVLPLVVEPVVPEPPIVPPVVEPTVLVPPIEPVVDVPPMLPPVLSVPMLPVPLVLLPAPDVPRVRLLDELPRDERVVLLPVVLEPLAEVPDWPVEPDVPIWSPPMLPPVVEPPMLLPDVVPPAPPDVPPVWAMATLGMIREIAAIEVRMRISSLLTIYRR